MKFSAVKLLTLLLVFVSLVLLNQSCKKLKEDSQINNEIQVTKHPLEDRFLAVPDSMPNVVKKIAAHIKLQKNKSAFISDVITKVGLPAWDKSLIIVSAGTSNRTGSVGSDSNYVFVPVVPDGTKEVDGALACLVVGDSVNIKFLNEKDYRQYGFENNNAGNAEKLVGLMMYLQHKAFGTTSFVVNDERLIYGNAPHADSTRKELIHFEAVSNTANRQSKNKTGIAALYAEVQVCYAVDYYGCSNPAHYGQLCGELDKIGYHTINQCQTYTVWLSGGGGSGAPDTYNPPTSGGGGTSGSVSTQTYLQQILGLTEQEAAIFESYPGLGDETYNYCNNSDGQFTEPERKVLAISHTLLLGTNPEYTDYCAMRFEDNPTVKGKRFPWFRMLSLQDEYPDLASNIQLLKLNAEKAFYLFNNAALNEEVNKYLQNNFFSEDAKHTILTKLYPEQYPGISFDNITSPSNAPDDPIIDNGISVEDIPQTPPQQAGRRIGKTANRNNTEDMKYGTNGDASGILTTEVGKDNNALFSNMSDLFHWCTIRDNQLATVGNAMIERFRTNTAPSTVYENPVLNQKVEYSAAFVNFLKLFGNKLRDGLIEKQGNINDINEIDMGKVRPIFNGAFNMTNGLQILINDTEYTEIQLDEFHVDINGKWTADVTVTIYDHFGLDKLDALVYQKYHAGFADWWLLQHARGFVPYTTKVTVRKRISGQL